MKTVSAKILSALTAVLVLIAALSGCSGQSGSSGSTTAPEAAPTEPEQTTEDLYDKNGYRKDRIPDSTDFGSEVVDVLFWNNAKNAEYNPEDSGDIINSSIYKRNLLTEDRLNVKLNWIGERGDYGQRNEFNDVIAADLSGSNTYDVISAYSTTIAMAATRGYASDLLKFGDVISFDLPWWGTDLTDMATINGRLYFATGDISTNYLLRMYGTFFNKDLVDEYKLDNPYALVESGNWTVEYFISLASRFGDDGTSADPVFGLVHDAITLEALFYGSGLRFVEKDARDVPYLSDSWKSVRAQDLMDRVAAFCSGISVKNDSKNDEALFAGGSSLFIIYSLDLAMNSLQGGGIDYGIVPIPKFDADQAGYFTTLNYKYSLYMISKGTDIPLIAATTLEALASQSYRTVTPNLYEIAMKIRYTTDVTSQKMIDYIRDGVSFEIGRTFTHVFNYDTYRTIRKQLAGTEQKGWQTVAAGLEGSFRENLNTLLQAFAD